MNHFSINDIAEYFSGFSSFQFTPSQNLSNIPNVVSAEISSAVSFSGSNDWYDGSFLKGSSSLSEKQKEIDGNDYHELLFSARVPGHDKELLALFQEMKRYRHIILVTDNQGDKRLCGTLQEPLRFSFNVITQEQPGDFKGIEFSFYGNLQNPAPVYTA